MLVLPSQPHPLTMAMAVFLDRDGVLNEAIVREGKPFAPQAMEDLKLAPGAVDACHQLKTAGFLLIGVTNQPDVVRGTTKKELVESINAHVSKELGLHDLRTCYHDNADNCLCRKPKPGMILDAAKQWKIDLSRSYMVGDRSGDIEAGRRAGVTTIFIEHHYSEELKLKPDFVTASLKEASLWILKNSRQ